MCPVSLLCVVARLYRSEHLTLWSAFVGFLLGIQKIFFLFIFFRQQLGKWEHKNLIVYWLWCHKPQLHDSLKFQTLIQLCVHT